MAAGLLCMLGVIVLWSMVPVLVKWLLPDIEPFTLACSRLAQAVLVVLLAFRLRGRRLRDLRCGRWHWIGGLGVSLNYALFALSLTLTTASAGVLVVQVQYVTLALLAAAVLGERLGPAKLAGMGLVLSGVVLVVAVRGEVSQLLAPRYAAGNLLMLGAGIGWGIYALANKALANKALANKALANRALAGGSGTLSILLPMLAIGTAVTGALAAVTGEAVTLPAGPARLQLVLLGVAATGGAFILVSEAMRRLSAALVGTMTTVTPLAQIGLAHTLLDEPLPWSLGAGGALILAGVAAMVTAERRAAQRAAA